MNILLSGFCGKMGQVVYNTSKDFNSLQITEGFDREESIKNCSCNFEGVNLICDLKKSKNCDVVIDFSHISNLDNVLTFCKENKKPLVLATTGLKEQDVEKVKELSKSVPVFMSGNMSEGVFVLLNLIKEATKMLEGWDVEIIEEHHNLKADSPSGTAKMMLNEVCSVRDNLSCVYGRNPSSGKRSANEIGVHSIRGGGVVGEHSIEFFSENEKITISHEAFSKGIFAEGALKAALFIANKKPGLYSMKHLFSK